MDGTVLCILVIEQIKQNCHILIELLKSLNNVPENMRVIRDIPTFKRHVISLFYFLLREQFDTDTI